MLVVQDWFPLISADPGVVSLGADCRLEDHSATPGQDAVAHSIMDHRGVFFCVLLFMLYDYYHGMGTKTK